MNSLQYKFLTEPQLCKYLSGMIALEEVLSHNLLEQSSVLTQVSTGKPDNIFNFKSDLDLTQYAKAKKDVGLTHYLTIPHFDAPKIYSCGKHREKGEIACNKAISPFFTMFSTLNDTYFSFQMRSKMLSAICFNLD